MIGPSSTAGEEHQQPSRDENPAELAPPPKAGKLFGTSTMDKFFTSVPRVRKGRADGRVDPGFAAALDALVSPPGRRKGSSR
jgi:hypothetical protein